MRGKSPASEIVSEKKQIAQLVGFKKGFGNGDNFLVKISFCRISSSVF